MRLATVVRYLYLSYLSKPAGDRILFRALRRHRVRKILEIGIGTTDRTLRMVRLAERLAAGDTVRYSAVDLFEARPKTVEALSLKEAHRLLKTTTAHSQLIPGEPAPALSRTANSLPGLDLVLISAAHDEASLAGAWFYLPRMLHDGSVVLRETAGEAGLNEWRRLKWSKIRELASVGRRRAA